MSSLGDWADINEAVDSIPIQTTPATGKSHSVRSPNMMIHPDRQNNIPVINGNVSQSHQLENVQVQGNNSDVRTNQARAPRQNGYQRNQGQEQTSEGKQGQFQRIEYPKLAFDDLIKNQTFDEVKQVINLPKPAITENKVMFTPSYSVGENVLSPDEAVARVLEQIFKLTSFANVATIGTIHKQILAIIARDALIKDCPVDAMLFVLTLIKRRGGLALLMLRRLAASNPGLDRKQMDSTSNQNYEILMKYASRGVMAEYLETNSYLFPRSFDNSLRNIESVLDSLEVEITKKIEIRTEVYRLCRIWGRKKARTVREMGELVDTW